MLKKAKIRLLTRAAHCREWVFAGVYRAATVMRESVPNDFFSSLLEAPSSESARRAEPARCGSFLGADRDVQAGSRMLGGQPHSELSA